VDTNRLDESFSPLDYFESKGIPFIVAVNQFQDTPVFDLSDIAEALALRPDVPMIRIDARDRASSKQALLRITEYALECLTRAVPAKVN